MCGDTSLGRNGRSEMKGASRFRKAKVASGCEYGAKANAGEARERAGPLQSKRIRRYLTMAHMVFCTKYKQEMEGLDEPPFDSDFGQKIYKNVSKKAWGEWVERLKMLLNEYRLEPWTREAQEFLVEQMNGLFFGEGEGGALPKEYVTPT